MNLIQEKSKLHERSRDREQRGCNEAEHQKIQSPVGGGKPSARQILYYYHNNDVRKQHARKHIS